MNCRGLPWRRHIRFSTFGQISKKWLTIINKKFKLIRTHQFSGSFVVGRTLWHRISHQKIIFVWNRTHRDRLPINVGIPHRFSKRWIHSGQIGQGTFNSSVICRRFNWDFIWRIGFAQNWRVSLLKPSTQNVLLLLPNLYIKRYIGCNTMLNEIYQI